MGKSLPPGLLIKTGKFVWSTMWHLMMSQMAPRDATGAYIRPESSFRHWLAIDEGIEDKTADADIKTADADINDADINMDRTVKPGRYHLIVGLGCPWAHRTLVTRALKGLAAAVPVVSVSPSPDQGIWVMDRPFHDCRTLPELYQKAQPHYDGRCTVPILWDNQHHKIINNESADIIVMLNRAFDDVAQHPLVDLYPPHLKDTIDDWNQRIYTSVNNGVYRCGFAQTQRAYDQACQALFETLDHIDQVLVKQRYLCGDRLTLADVRLFTTLFRFDLVYYGLFKCNRRRIQDYAQLGPYLRDLYQLPGVAETCHADAVKRDYYGNLFPLNPGGIIPGGPAIEDLALPHGRAILDNR